MDTVGMQLQGVELSRKRLLVDLARGCLCPQDELVQPLSKLLLEVRVL